MVSHFRVQSLPPWNSVARQALSRRVPSPVPCLVCSLILPTSGSLKYLIYFLMSAIHWWSSSAIPSKDRRNTLSCVSSISSYPFQNTQPSEPHLRVIFEVMLCILFFTAFSLLKSLVITSLLCDKILVYIPAWILLSGIRYPKMFEFWIFRKWYYST